MDIFNCYDKNKGYNICKEAGTTRGKKHSETTIQKIKDHLPNRYGKNNSFYGKHHTIKTRERLSELGKKRKFSDEHRMKLKIARATNKAGYKQRPLAQIDLANGNIVKVWESLKDASMGIGISRTLISECCHNKKKSAKGYGWKFNDS